VDADAICIHFAMSQIFHHDVLSRRIADG
jgi:hypothetical protein